MGQVILERVSEFIRLLKGWRASSYLLAHGVGSSAQRVESVTLYKDSGEVAARVADDRAICRVREYFYLFDLHWRPASVP